MGWIARTWAAATTLPPRQGWLLGAWFGLLIGFTEIVHETVRERVFGVVLHHKSEHFLWMVPLTYLLLGLVAGGLVAGLARLAPRLMTLPVAVFALVFFGVWGQLLAHESLHLAAVLALSGGIAWQLARSRALGGPRVLRWSRRSLPWMIGAVAIAAVAVPLSHALAESRAMAALPPGPKGAPNVVLIVLDTVRVDHLSLHGYGRETTPNIDALGREGVVFDACFSTSPWTLPSHITMFTGRYPHETEADWLVPFREDYPTLAEALAARGYATGGFVGNLGYCGSQNGIDRGFVRYEDFYVKPDVFAFSSLVGSHFASRYLGHPFGTMLRNDAETVTSRFLEWTRELDGRPFFAFLNYYDAHEDYLPPAGFDIYDPTGDPTSAYGTSVRPDAKKQIVAAHDGCIRFIDHHIGRLVSELESAGLLDDTILVVTSDHGELFGEHGLQGHGHSLYRPLLHVPLVVWSRRGLPPGRRIAEYATLRDLATTILELTETEPAAAFPGQSLSRLWRTDGATPADPSPLLSEVSEGKWTPPFVPISGGDMKCLVEAPFHFITGGSRGDELYDLAADPREETNLVDTPDGTETAARLRRTIDGLVQPK